MRKIGVALAFTAALASGCSSSAEQSRGHTAEPTSVSQSAPSTTPTPTVPPQPTYEQSKAALITYYGDAQAYWKSQGVDISATKLDIVEGDQTFTCDKPYHAADIAAGYCKAYETIFDTQGWIQYMESDHFFLRSAYELPREEVFATHESSHPAQYVLKLIISAEQYKDPTFATENELEADCFAGGATRAIDPGATKIVLDPRFVYFPGDDYPGQSPTGHHGTTAQRRQEFINGFNGGACQLGQ